MESLKFKNIQADEKYMSMRNYYMNVYRKYQAAVNYGEFERVPAVDVFVANLRAKDWTALDNIPTQLKYFTGKIGLAESGLKIYEQIY